ncbi:MAG: serine hydrolase [Bacteroidota bacterium]
MTDTHTAEHKKPGFLEDVMDNPAGLPVAGHLMAITLLLAVIFAVGYSPKIFALLKNADVPTMNAPSSISSTTAPSFPDYTIASLDDVSITGEAAFVWDVRNQRTLYEKNPDEQLPLASIAKLMTSLLAHELIAADTNVDISLSAIYQDGESGLITGETFSLETLMDMMLLSSSNDGAFAIANVAGAKLDEDNAVNAFVKAMNIRAAELGLVQTYYRNPTGLDISTSEAGAYGSARDTAFLLTYILQNHPELLEQTTVEEATFYNQDGAYHRSYNTNQYVESVPNLIGSKTGYTTLAGGNLAVAFDASLNRPVVIVVLGSTFDGRFADIATLTEAVQMAMVN